MAFSLSTRPLLYLPPQTVAPKQHCLLPANITLVSPFNSPTHRRLYSSMSIPQSHKVLTPKRVFQKQMVRGFASSLFSLAVDVGEDPKMEKNKEEVNNGFDSVEKNKEEVNNGFDSVECSTGSSIGVAPPHRSVHIGMGERTKSQISLLAAILFLVCGGWKLFVDELLNSPDDVSGVLDSLFEKGEVIHSRLKFLSLSTRLSMEKILVYYILHLLEKKPFHPGLVAKLIHLKKESKLEDDKVARVLKMTSKLSIDKGCAYISAEELDSESEIPSHFGEIYYLSKLPEFCSVDCCVDIKRIFSVSDEDAEKLLANTMIVGGLGLETEVD